ncbi:MAG: hypothetical protein Q9201_001954 [Fulgogasparrea decipioides]
MPSAPSLRKSALLLPLLAVSINGQVGSNAFAIYNSTKRLPDGCIEGFAAGHDEVFYNVPYTYQQVLSVIGSFANITWNGINSTTLNGTDNTVGTARFYSFSGIPLIETIKTYQKPANGPYFEDHTLAPAYNPFANLTIYAPFDSQNFTPICGGTATSLNFTVDFCSTNVTGAGQILHDSHVFDAVTLQEFLGNETWTGCTNTNGSTSTAPVIPSGTGVVGPTGTGGAVSPTGTGSAGSTGNGTSVGGGAGAGPTAPPAAFTGGAATVVASFGAVAAGVVALFFL